MNGNWSIIVMIGIIILMVIVVVLIRALVFDRYNIREKQKQQIFDVVTHLGGKNIRIVKDPAHADFVNRNNIAPLLKWPIIITYFVTYDDENGTQHKTKFWFEDNKDGPQWGKM